MDKQKQEIAQNIPEADVEVVNDGEALKVTFDSGILFATNSSTVSDASKSALHRFANTLKDNPDTDIRIVGYTDNTGQVDYNQTLSEKRAQSVYSYLQSEGASTNRMEFMGKGINNPVADNSTSQGRAQNRRVEILIEANENMRREAQAGTLQ
ncbi:MAG: OmpA family protein [Tannerellaceae bacterium]|nr:OmpA family protein [Tannerellaceae bacterium]